MHFLSIIPNIPLWLLFINPTVIPLNRYNNWKCNCVVLSQAFTTSMEWLADLSCMSIPHSSDCISALLVALSVPLGLLWLAILILPEWPVISCTETKTQMHLLSFVSLARSSFFFIRFLNVFVGFFVVGCCFFFAVANLAEESFVPKS